MIPTLMIGDFILVNKFAYGLRLPVVHTKIVPTGEPERGDVVVFRFPLKPKIDFIKRIIGLPGDVIEYRDKQVFVNGKRVPQTKLGVYTGENAAQMLYSISYREHLGDVTHKILKIPRRPSEAAMRFKVPEGHYFVMGDNRDNSDDSRSWGFVPEQNLVGRAVLIWMSWNSAAGHPALGRFGKMIH
jgi:signal peptidase I